MTSFQERGYQRSDVVDSTEDLPEGDLNIILQRASDEN